MPILLADDFPPVFGGIQNCMRGLADALHALGRHVVVIAPDHSEAPSYDRDLPYRVIRYRARTRLDQLVNISTICMANASKSDYTLAALWFPGGLSASALPRFRRGPLGVFVHGTDVLKPRGLSQLIMRGVLSRADHVFANGNYSKKLISDAGVHRSVEITPCGVNDFKVSVNRADVPVVLAVGRLTRRKGFDRLIQALPAIRNAEPLTILEIVGDGPDRLRLLSLAEEVGVSHAVRFLGAVSDPVLHAAYGRAWCFALPARRVENDVEGFGIVYLEAAIAGLPVIGGIDSGASDAIADGESGVLVDGSDPSAIARAVSSLLLDRRIARNMGLRGRERALRDFSWSRSARLIDAFMTNTSYGRPLA